MFSVKPGHELKKDLMDSLIGLGLIFVNLGLDGFTLAKQVQQCLWCAMFSCLYVALPPCARSCVPCVCVLLHWHAVLTHCRLHRLRVACQDNINKSVSKGNEISTSQFMCFHNVWAAVILVLYVVVDHYFFTFGAMSSLVRHAFTH